MSDQLSATGCQDSLQPDPPSKATLDQNGKTQQHTQHHQQQHHQHTNNNNATLKTLKKHKQVILPLYPQFSISTSGSSLRLIEALFKADPNLARLEHTVIPSWYQRPGYVKAMAALIEAELDRFPDPAEVRAAFFCSGVCHVR